MMRRCSLLFFIILFFSISYAQEEPSQEPSSLVIYGSEASTREGDNDFIQVIFIEIPEAIQDTLYLRIYDADCGGLHDSQYGVFNTETRFSFFGGSSIFTIPSVKTPFPDEASILTGQLLAQETCGITKFRDNIWYNLCAFLPQQGEKVGDKYYFKLVVEGLTGNDANVFDIFMSSEPKRNVEVEKAMMFNYSPTIRLPAYGVHAELRFIGPTAGLEISVHNFDLAGARMWVETPFRSKLPVATSGQDSWAESVVILEESEQGRLCALLFQGGEEIPNDATCYILNVNGDALPIHLPIYIQGTNHRPIAEYDIKPLTTPRTIMFDAARSSDQNGNALKYYWEFGDGTTGEGRSVTHTYPKTGLYEAVLIVSDNSGQVGNSTLLRFPVWVNLPPVAEAGVYQKGAPGQEISFDGSASYDTDGKLVRYSWDFGDGSRVEGVTVTHKYKRAGHYRVTLRVVDESGSPLNFGFDETEVWINSAPVVEIGENIACSPNETVTLSGEHCYDADGDIIGYYWDLGDGTQQSGMTITHAYKQPGTYKVTATLEDDAGVANSTATDWLTIVVNDQPVAVIAADRDVVSVNETINFDGTGSFDRDGKLIEHKWNYGDGIKGDEAKTSHAYNYSGVYTVRLTVRDNSGTSTEYAFAEKTIVVNYPSVAHAGIDQLVTASVVYFDGSASSDKDGQIIQYSWDFGDGGSGNGVNPSHVYGNPGTYKVTLTVTDDSHTSTDNNSDEMTVIVNYVPISDAGIDQVGAPGQVLTFDGSGSTDMVGEIVSYHWDFGDGQLAEGQTVTHQFNKPGSYSVMLTVHDNTGHENAYGTDECRIFVNAPPVAAAGAGKLAAPGDQITFNGSVSFNSDGEIASYSWKFSDGLHPSDKVITKRSFDKPGMYSAVLTVMDNSGAVNAQAQDELIVHINHSPEAKPGNNIHTNIHKVNFNGSASADADGHKLSYRWDFGDGSEHANGMKVSHIYEMSGIYPVILTVDDGTGLKNSFSSASITVQVNEAPLADAGENMTVCAGDMVLFGGGDSFDPEGGVLKFQWDFGDGSSAEGINPTKKYTAGGVYKVTLTVYDDSGMAENYDIDCIVVKVAESPVAEAGADKTVGVNEEVHFDGTASTDLDGLVNSYSWDFGDGTTGGGPNPTHVYTEPGVYRVTLTITGDKVGECSNQDTDDLMVTVHDAPIADFQCVNIIPLGDKVEFDASSSSSRMSNITKYSWEFGDGNFAEGAAVTHTYMNPGNYIVTLTVFTDSDTEFNKGVAKRLVVVNGTPTANAGVDKLAGINQQILFDGSSSMDADGAVTSYDWDFGDGTSGNSIRVKHQYSAAGKYTVTLKVKDNTELPNNWSIDTAYVTINEAPVPVIEAVEWAAVNESVSFSGAGSYDSDGEIVSYHWICSDGSTCEGVEFIHAFANPGECQVTLSVDDGRNVNNSKAFSTVQIKVNHPPVAVGGPDRIVSPGEVVEFDGSLSQDIDGEITYYHWDFGDGGTAEGAKVSHVYEQPGRMLVRLTVSDNSGVSSGRAYDEVSVRVNAAPIAVAGGDIEAYFEGAHDGIVFDASKSYDPDGDPLTYHWDFGDGKSANGMIVTHKYLKPGTYTVKLTVNDGSGVSSGKSTDEIKVRVRKRD